MATNTTITPLWIGRDVLRVASNETRFVRNITKKLSDDFVVEGAKVGATVGIRLPQRWVTTKGQALQQQGITNQVVYLTITDQANIGWAWSSRLATLDIQDTRENYVNPAAIQLANTMDKDGLARLYLDVYQAVGTPGILPTANTVYYSAADILTQVSAVPSDSRTMVVNSTTGTAIANANLSLFNMGNSRDAFDAGVLSNGALKWKQWLEDVNVFPHVYGTYGGTPVISGADQEGNSLTTTGWSSGASTLRRGDVFTIGSGATATKAVNVQSYQDAGFQQEFVVSQTVSDTTGSMTITFTPAIVPTVGSPFRNVVASPTNGASINVRGTSGVTSTQNLGFHKQAFVMGSVDLVMPVAGSGRAERIRAPKTGLSLRLWEASDIMTDQHPSRLDAAYGFLTQRPDWAVRVESA